MASLYCLKVYNKSRYCHFENVDLLEDSKFLVKAIHDHSDIVEKIKHTKHLTCWFFRRPSLVKGLPLLVPSSRFVSPPINRHHATVVYLIIYGEGLEYTRC